MSIWWFSVIVLPLFYGLPKTQYLAFKGVLKQSAIFSYLFTPIIWTFIFAITAVILTFSLPGVVDILLNSWGVNFGGLLGFWGSVLMTIFSKDRHRDLETDFWAVQWRYIRFDRLKKETEIVLRMRELFEKRFGEKADQKLEEFLEKLKSVKAEK